MYLYISSHIHKVILILVKKLINSKNEIKKTTKYPKMLNTISCILVGLFIRKNVLI